jgi:hypothetical protein
MKAITLPLVVCALMFASAVAAESTFQPFVLASISEAGLEEQTTATIDALEQAGFTVAGSYAPLDTARVIVVTSDELLAIAAASDGGAYAAGQRVSVSERNGQTEVAFINPLYVQFAYRLKGDMQPVRDRLSEALGEVESFGAEKKMTAEKLGDYHYKPFMPYFDDPWELGSFDSHEAAVEAVESGLAREGDPLTLVYRIDLPGTDQAVFGVGMKATSDDDREVDIDEAHQLSIVDFDGYSKVAYFPYEILVDGSDVKALAMKFRMAVHFPDLTMMGKHSFFTLKSSPGSTREAFEGLVAAQ